MACGWQEEDGTAAPAGASEAYQAGESEAGEQQPLADNVPGARGCALT